MNSIPAGPAATRRPIRHSGLFLVYVITLFGAYCFGSLSGIISFLIVG